MKKMYATSAAVMLAMAAAGKGGGAAAKEVSKFETFEIPAAGVFGARAGNVEFNKSLDDCPVNASFLEVAEVADTITDPKERAAAFKEEQNKLANRVNGAIRRYKAKEGNEAAEFAVRKVDDDKLGHGVRIWKVKAA